MNVQYQTNCCSAPPLIFDVHSARPFTRPSAARRGTAKSREFSTVFAKYALMFDKQKLQMQWHSLLGDHGGLDQ